MSGLTTHVLDTAHGRPAAGVRLRLMRDGAVVASATTNADGRFEFAGLSRGSGTLLAGDCSDAMDAHPIEIRGKANVADVDLTAFIQSCPWVFLR
jgi:hypothetical protein